MLKVLEVNGMLKKERAKNGTMHYVYICDYCEVKFKKGLGKMIYKLKGKFGEGQKHFCCYNCRSKYIKENTNGWDN